MLLAVPPVLEQARRPRSGRSSLPAAGPRAGKNCPPS
jgi:hypothetical protein